MTGNKVTALHEKVPYKCVYVCVRGGTDRRDLVKGEMLEGRK